MLSPSKHEGGPRRFGLFLAIILSAGLAACASGSRSDGIRDPALAGAYFGLPNTKPLLPGGAAVVVAPGIAATCRHNANLLVQDDILAVSDRYDLLFFHTDRTAQDFRTSEPSLGLVVTAYGQGRDNELREATGPIELIEPTYQECPGCPPGTAFAYRARAAPAFPAAPSPTLKPAPFWG